MDHVLGIMLASLAGLSSVLAVWQWLAAYRFRRRARLAAHGFYPDVTILKPLKGCDGESRACLRSWFELTYPGSRQLLFGVDTFLDPVCEVVRELMAEFPEADVALVECQPLAGANAKVSKLAILNRKARYDFLVISDADVLAPADLLNHLIGPFQAEHIVLVNCLYGLANPTTLAMRWEAVAVNADFWSQVLQCRMIWPMDFALGAVMAVRRQALEDIGGLARFQDQLADDYALGNQLARRGGRLELASPVARCRSDAMGWIEVWRHQLRWGRTIRVCRPMAYGLSVLSNTTWWYLLWLLFSPGIPVALAALAGVGLRVGIAHQLQRWFLPEAYSARYAWLIPVKDLLQIFIWAFSFLGNGIYWRGKQYRVQRDGRLEGLTTSVPAILICLMPLAGFGLT